MVTSRQYTASKLSNALVAKLEDPITQPLSAPMCTDDGALCVPVVQTYSAPVLMLDYLIHRGAVIGRSSPENTVPKLQLLIDTGCHAHDLMCLIAAGAVTVGNSDFGDTYLQASSEDLVVPSTTICYDVVTPTSVLHAASTSDNKLALFLALRRAGWIAIGGPLAAHRPGGIKCIDNAMLPRSMLYLKAMLGAAELFSKGLDRIEHYMTASYYKCILVLKDLRGFSHRADFKSLRDADFKQICASGDALRAICAEDAEECVALVDARVDDDGDGDELFDPLEMFDAALPSEAQRCKLFGMKLHGRTVRFDGGRHQSGHQRGYITCSRNHIHDGCYKYRQVKEFPSHSDCAAWLFLWDQLGSDMPTRHEHYAFDPPPAMVAKVRARLPDN